MERLVDTCPVCGSYDVKWSTVDDPDYWDFGNGLAWRQGYCNECAAVFEEQYDIARVFVLGDDIPCGTE